MRRDGRLIRTVTRRGMPRRRVLDAMKKIRVVFVLVSAVLLVPLALLVRKALASAASESSAKHRAVAERVFDEMERELTAFLRREENRPFEHYRYSYVPGLPAARQGQARPGDGAPAAARQRSPLADAPADAFVLGYFQIHPDGIFSSPHRPGPRELEAAGWQPTAEVEDWVRRLEEVVGLAWRLKESDAPPAAGAPSQMAGSTVELGAKAAPEKLPQERFLDSLNRGARSRSQRLSKREQTQATNVDESLDEFLSRSAEPARRDEAEVIDVRLEPMVGRSAGDGLLVLYRTVAVGEKAYRQGLLADTTALITWLEERVLTDRALAARATFAAGSAADAPNSAAAYSYRHRFAEPFGSVHGVLALEPLPELAATVYLYALSALLALAATVGLWALYRMVAVVVEYAERRNNFVSAVTHELKTPLTAIRMYGEMLRDGVVPEEAKRQQYYETITSETERLTRLLQNVLELARLEKDTRTMNLTVGDVGEVAGEVIAVLGPHATQQGFALRLDAEPDLPRVRYDRDALVQVLFNLVDNALKYSRGAERQEIVLRCRRQRDGVALAVADHGPGVAREHQRKIFEPFYRGESELTRTAKGTGIGLALVRGLVERMGGSVVGRNAGRGGFEVVVSLSGA